MTSKEYKIGEKTIIVYYNKYGIARVTKELMEQSFLPALEKQIPKKPVMWGDGYADGELVMENWECPNCGTTYEIEEQHRFCPNCGQAIDWSDEE